MCCFLCRNLAVAPPTQNSAPPTGNQPFLSALLPNLPPSSLANKLITQGPALESVQVAQVLPQAVDPAQPISPSLNANEEILFDDSVNETRMEVAGSSGGLSVLPAVPPIPPAGSHSDSGTHLLYVCEF